MSTNRGIFENFPSQQSSPKDSPFAVVPDSPEPSSVASPFAQAVRSDSPFTVMDEKSGNPTGEAARQSRVPEKRKVDSPFQVSEPGESFGFEAPAKPAAKEGAAASPFAPAPQQPFPSPFSAEPSQQQPVPAPSSPQAAIAAFGNWGEPSQATQPAPAKPAQAPQQHQPVPPVEAPASFDESLSDSFSIRQLELRAIFGVDREMTTAEILQRSRALPGIRHIARVSQRDMGTIESLKSLLPNLGFGSGTLRLYAGSVPLEFIREGSVLLAVQTDGGFAPGVRETLMLVARELGKME